MVEFGHMTWRGYLVECPSALKKFGLKQLRPNQRVRILSHLRLYDIPLSYTQNVSSIQYTLKWCTLWNVRRSKLYILFGYILTSTEKWWRHIHWILVRSSDTILYLKEPYSFDLNFADALSSNKGTMCSIYLDILLGR